MICYACSVGDHSKCYSKEYHYGEQCRCCGRKPATIEAAPASASTVMGKAS